MSLSQVRLVRRWAERPSDGFVRVLRLRALGSPYVALAKRVGER